MTVEHNYLSHEMVGVASHTHEMEESQTHQDCKQADVFMLCYVWHKTVMTD